LVSCERGYEDRIATNTNGTGVPMSSVTQAFCNCNQVNFEVITSAYRGEEFVMKMFLDGFMVVIYTGIWYGESPWIILYLSYKFQNQ
jgi:hypothetical protein